LKRGAQRKGDVDAVLGVIVEFKGNFKKYPSTGVFCELFHAAKLANRYDIIAQYVYYTRILQQTNPLYSSKYYCCDL
jgi:hypothetical protein